MPLNFGGLGFGFEVFDDGAKKAVEGIGNAVSSLWDDLKRVSDVGPKFGRTLADGLGKLGQRGGKAFGAISMAMGSMIDKAMSPELDHAYSSMYTGFNKSFSALTAGMNITEKEMANARKKIGSAAFGMGEDMEGAARDWVVFRKQGLDLNKVLGTSGLTGTVKGLIKVTSVYDIQGEQLAQVMGNLVKGFGYTEEAVGGLADKIVASGKVFNMGKDAIQSWPAILESLNAELADFGKTLSPEEIDNMTLSIVQLGGGLKEALGLAPQEALELSRSMFTTIAGERKNIINMFRGMGGEFGDMAKGLMETGGDVNKMFELMSSGDPLKFMDTLRAMSAEAEKQGGQTGIAFQRLSGVMSEALGPDVAFAMKGNWDKAQEAMAKIPDALKGSKGLFKKTADEHWKSSITVGESWDRMMESMKAKLFGLSRKEVGTWKKQMQSGFKDTFQVVSTLAGDDGPLGELTRRMLAVKRVGLTALIPGLSGLAPLLGGITSPAIPMLTAMGSMGLTFGSIGKMALGGGLLFGVFKLLTDGPEKAWEQISSFGDNFSKLFDKLPKKTQEKINKIKEQFNGFLDNLKSGKVFDKIGKFFDKIPFEKIFTKVGEVFVAVAGGLGKLLSKVDWESFAKITFKLIGKAVASVGGIFTALFGGTDGGVDGAQKAGMSDAFLGVAKMLKGIVLGAFKGIWASVFDAKSIGESMKKLASIVTVSLTGLLVFSGKFRKVFTGGFRNMFKSIKGMGKMIGGAGIFMGVMEGMQQVEKRMKSIGDVMADDLIPEFAKTSMAGKEAFKGVMSTIDAALFGLPSMIGKALGLSADGFDEFYFDMVASAEKFFAHVFHGFNSLVDGMGISWDTFKNIVAAGWEFIKASASYVGKSLKSMWVNVVTHLEGTFDTFVTGFQRIFLRMRQGIELGMFKVRDVIARIIESLPPIARTESMSEFASSFKKFKEEVGGEEGLKKLQKKEAKSFEKQAEEREESRATERLAAQKEQTEAAANAVAKAFLIKGAYTAGEMKQRESVRKNMDDLNRDLAGIDEGLAKTKKANEDAKKREAAKTQVEEEVAEVEKESKKGRGRRRRKQGGATEETVKDMVAVVKSQQAEMIKKTEILQSAVEAMKNSPIDLYVTAELDGKKVSKNIRKHEVNGAMGSGV